MRIARVPVSKPEVLRNSAHRELETPPTRLVYARSWRGMEAMQCDLTPDFSATGR